MKRFALLPALLIASASTGALAHHRHAEYVAEDQPVAWWRFEAGEQTLVSQGSATSPLVARPASGAKVDQPGPRPAVYRTFESDNHAAAFNGRGSRLVVDDPGAESPLDFTVGDAITIEAWVKPASLSSGQTMYVVGKGRTGNKGFPADNQNYGLRLLGKDGRGGLSFLFREASNQGGREGWHRWDSAAAFAIDGQWHHVAVAYRFGEPGSIRGYVDGEAVKGTWDTGYGGPTERGPVVDDDQLWIGSSMGGSAGATFNGGLDEVAIYRTLLAPERIELRYDVKPPEPYVREEPLPEDGVLVEVFDSIASPTALVTKPPTTEYVEHAFGFPDYPHAYDERGLRVEPKTPLLFRATARVELEPGEYEVLVRARGDARLFVDEQELVHVPKLSLSGSAHGRMYDASVVKEPDLHDLWAGDNERLVTFETDGGEHVFQLAMTLGEKNRRPETGENGIAIRQRGESTFHLLTPRDERIPLTDDGWYEYAKAATDRVEAFEQKTRLAKSAEEREYWHQRHERVRETVAATPGPAVPESVFPEATHNAVDRFVNARLKGAGRTPAEAVDDWAFLRRVTIDLIGTVPTEEQIAAFFADESPDRRERYVDRLLRHPGWADNWVGYWQDVLAENPNVLKPTLNNTGPFRWWIHESFLDDKPMDRFVTELLLMEGGTYAGGPGGFALATQNDVPMAAKAHVVAQAFMGQQMKCARCHDAPFRDFVQADLFSLAAMLNRGPQNVPNTSTVPVSPEVLAEMIVNVSLKPGTKVPPEWPFPDVAPPEVPAGFLRDAGDSRARLAALITAPDNERFARVMVNRLWHRYLGRGIVEPVDDWSGGDPSHPELLDWLAREFLLSGYDLKHVARLIVTSHTYQRQAIGEQEVDEPYLFAAPLRRRMTAEQILDSMFVAAGKDLHAGELNFDLDGARPRNQFLNLGRPERAWEFTSLSNERDRPSLALPFAQDFVSLLETFGWRSSRQDPITEREDDPTVLQPAIMANGIVTGRVTRLSDDAELTELVLEEDSVEDVVDRMARRILTRPPTSEERELFGELLRDGFENREIDVDPSEIVKYPARPQKVSWGNHFDPKANELKVEHEAQVRRGDPPSVRLRDDWRERAEDVVWALVNTPEFVFLP